MDIITKPATNRIQKFFHRELVAGKSYDDNYKNMALSRNYGFFN